MMLINKREKLVVYVYVCVRNEMINVVCVD